MKYLSRMMKHSFVEEDDDCLFMSADSRLEAKNRWRKVRKIRIDLHLKMHMHAKNGRNDTMRTE